MFNRKGFSGVVYLKDWLQFRDGRSYRAVAGVLSVLTDEEQVGFKVKGTESNWCVRVEGVESSDAMIILGCQIRAVEVTNGEINADVLRIP